jgi:hypothetical protein
MLRVIFLGVGAQTPGDDAGGKDEENSTSVSENKYGHWELVLGVFAIMCGRQ